MHSFEEYQKEEIEAISKIEALLFVAPGLTSITQLSSFLSIKENKIIEYITILNDHYHTSHGIRIQILKNQVQLTTAPEFSELIELFLGLESTTRLTQASLEALSIIAYKQPTTRPEIDSIRGVNSDGVIKSLLAKGLIEELGRSDAVGRPIFYGVTAEFLQHFGLTSLDDLPKLNFQEMENKESAPEENKRILKD